MTGNPIRNNEPLQQTIEERITALLDQYVNDGILIEYEKSLNGQWTTLARFGEIRRSVFMHVTDLVTYLDGLATAKAFYNALKEIEVIQSRLGSLVYRGILTMTLGDPPNDHWIVAGPKVPVRELRSRAEAYEFLSEFDA